LSAPGHALDSATLAYFEPRLGADFSHVRIHADDRAAKSASDVDAQAYTVGRHVVFGPGRYAPHTTAGRQLLTHELAHVVQQQNAVPDGAPLSISRSGDASEQQADAAVQALQSGAAIPTLLPSSLQVARQPKSSPAATTKDEERLADTMAGAQVSQIIVWLGPKRVAFQTSRGWVLGDVDTDLAEGSYELTPDVRKRKWKILKPAVIAGRRFVVDLEGAIPWTLAYPSTLTLTVTSGSQKAETGDITDASGVGYNAIYARAGPSSKAAVLALASLETPTLFVNVDAYKKLDKDLRKSILDLEQHAAGTDCAAWFDVMRANDPDFKPNLTPEQIRAGDAAYYESMREARLGKKAEAAKTEAPKLDGAKVEEKWKDGKYGLVTAAMAPNHGIKAEALFEIWVKYWADKIAIADKTLDAIIETELHDHVDLSETETYRKAKQVYDLGMYLLADSVGAIEICRAADAAGKSLTLNELTDRVMNHAKFMQNMQIAAAIVGALPRGIRGPGVSGKLPKSAPVAKAGPVAKLGPAAKTEPVAKTAPAVKPQPVIKPEPVAKTEPVVKPEPVAKTGPVKTEPTKAGPAKAEPAKAEPAKLEPPKAEPAKVEPAKAEPAKAEPPKVEQPKTGEKAEGGGRVVDGRPVKPRIATPTKYVWKNPRMKDGNFIEAELDGNGTLEVTVKSGGPSDIRVGGSKMLDDVFEHFGPDKIKQFDAKWVRNSSFRENYDAYTQNINKGMNPKDAAWNTWTGRQLKARGFTDVEVAPHGSNPEIVSPVFKK